MADVTEVSVPALDKSFLTFPHELKKCLVAAIFCGSPFRIQVPDVGLEGTGAVALGSF